MAELLEYNKSEMEKKATRMQNALDVVISEIGKLYTEILYRIGDDWKSSESHAYLNNLTDYLADLKELADSIQDYIALLRTAAQKYDDTMQESYVIASECNRS